MALAQVGKPVHLNGTALAAAQRIYVSDVANGVAPKPKGSLAWAIYIRNTGSDTVEISFDDGTAYYSIAAGTAFDFKGKFNSFVIRRGGASDVAYTAILSVA